jgi:hypothetical protein
MRVLTVRDLGARGSIQELTGSVSVVAGRATIRIEMIRGRIENPFEIIRNLARLARAEGARTLRIEGTLANERLYRILTARFGLSTAGAVDFIEVELERGEP